MRDILDELSRWFDDGETFALATVVRTWKSSPREPGAAMAVSQSGEVVGSVSEGASKAPCTTSRVTCSPTGAHGPRSSASPTTTPSAWA